VGSRQLHGSQQCTHRARCPVASLSWRGTLCTARRRTPCSQRCSGTNGVCGPVRVPRAHSTRTAVLPEEARVAGAHSVVPRRMRTFSSCVPLSCTSSLLSPSLTKSNTFSPQFFFTKVIDMIPSFFFTFLSLFSFSLPLSHFLALLLTRTLCLSMSPSLQ